MNILIDLQDVYWQISDWELDCHVLLQTTMYYFLSNNGHPGKSEVGCGGGKFV